jgi:ribonuclease HI
MPLKLYTDGSCIGNPGPGAWAFLLRGVNGEETRGQDGALETTNNRMELLAAIQGLRTAESLYPEERNIDIYSDSSWVVCTMNDGWKRKKNLDLWAELTPLVQGKKITWNWVRGHNGHKENEDCDVRAQAESRRQLQKLHRLSPSERKTLRPTNEEGSAQSLQSTLL